jgi:hypothetical protein
VQVVARLLAGSFEPDGGAAPSALSIKFPHQKSAPRRRARRAGRRRRARRNSLRTHARPTRKPPCGSRRGRWVVRAHPRRRGVARARRRSPRSKGRGRAGERRSGATRRARLRNSGLGRASLRAALRAMRRPKPCPPRGRVRRAQSRA